VLSVSLSSIWTKLSAIDTRQRQHERLMHTILDALQSSGNGSLELPDGITLPAETLQELFNIEKLLENGENYQKMVSTRQWFN